MNSVDSEIRFIRRTALIILIVLAIASIFATVPAGHQGIVTRFGAVNRTMDAGLHVRWPLIERVHRMDLRVKKLQVEASAASRDMQDVFMTVALNYRIDPACAATLYSTVGIEYEDTLIDPAIQESVKAASARYNAEELIVKRVDVAQTMEQRLTEKLGHYGIIVSSLSIVNQQFSEEFTVAIEAKQAAEQLSQKAERDLDRIRTEAEQKVVQAQAEAEALRIQKQDITPDLLRLREIEATARAIDKWDGRLPTITGDAIPFIDIQTKK